jgi:hypothetical protein
MAMPILLQPACSDWPALCWIEAHPGLAAWLQFLGAVGALGLTYASLRTTVTIAKAQLDYQVGSARREMLSLHEAAINAAEELIETMKSVRDELADANYRQAWATGRGPRIGRLERRRGYAEQYLVVRLGGKAMDAMQLVLNSYNLFLDT